MHFIEIENEGFVHARITRRFRVNLRRNRPVPYAEVHQILEPKCSTTWTFVEYL